MRKVRQNIVVNKCFYKWNKYKKHAKRQELEGILIFKDNPIQADQTKNV